MPSPQADRLLDTLELNPHGLQPIRDVVFIKREADLTDMSALNLIYPESDHRTIHIRQRLIMEKATGVGQVIAVGPGEITMTGERIPPEVQVGDRVLFGPYAGQDLKLPDGTELFTIFSKDIRAILPPKAQ